MKSIINFVNKIFWEKKDMILIQGKYIYQEWFFKIRDTNSYYLFYYPNNKFSEFFIPKYLGSIKEIFDILYLWESEKENNITWNKEKDLKMIFDFLKIKLNIHTYYQFSEYELINDNENSIIWTNNIDSFVKLILNSAERTIIPLDTVNELENHTKDFSLIDKIDMNYEIRQKKDLYLKFWQKNYFLVQVYYDLYKINSNHRKDFDDFYFQSFGDLWENQRENVQIGLAEKTLILLSTNVPWKWLYHYCVKQESIWIHYREIEIVSDWKSMNLDFLWNEIKEQLLTDTQKILMKHVLKIFDILSEKNINFEKTVKKNKENEKENIAYENIMKLINIPPIDKDLKQWLTFNKEIAELSNRL